MDIMETRAFPRSWGKILVTTDGSPESRDVVSQTLALAGGSSIFVLRVLELAPEVEAAATECRAFLEKEVQEALAAIAAEGAARGVNLKTLIRRDQPPFEAIVAEAARLGADVIIMSRSGRHGLARLLMGNVTARVIGHSPVHVLVVPPGGSIGWARLLVASDGSSYGEAAFQEALALARQTDGRLFALSAAREEGDIPEAQELVHRMLKAANQAGLRLTGFSPQGVQPDDAIVQAAIRQEVDLIILGSHGRTGLKRLLMGSVTERVIGQAPCPVLVVKSK